MDYKELGVGNKINMMRLKDAMGVRTKPKQYVSQLLDLDVSARVAKISMPIENKMVVPLEIGDIYRIIIYTSNGLYQCMAKISKRYKEGALYVLDVQFMGKLEKYQRRQYFRLLCNFQIEHRIETEQEKQLLQLLEEDMFENELDRFSCINEIEEFNKQWRLGDVVDISGGGIRFSSIEPYEKESIVILRVPIVVDIEGHMIPINTRIIYSNRKDFSSALPYDIRGEFVDIDNRTRELLVRYIFDEQRKRMKK